MMLERLKTDARIILGDAVEQLKKLPKGCADTVITSPPYWNLRDYQVKGQLGLEENPRDYIRNMVKVFRGVRRVLKDDGTLWMNMGDNYIHRTVQGQSYRRDRADAMPKGLPKGLPKGFKVKDKALMPHRLAIALQEDGWYVRQDIVWHKQQPQPETVNDRPTTAHEYLFLLSKSPQYDYNKDAIAEACSEKTELRSSAANALRSREERDAAMVGLTPKMRMVSPAGWATNSEARTAVEHSAVRLTRGRANESFMLGTSGSVTTRNKRSVWPVYTDRMDLKLCTACMRVYDTKEFGALKFRGELVDGAHVTHITCRCGRTDAWYSHFAAFGGSWIEPCVLAGCPPGGTVLDPFAGTCTTLGVAVAHGRKGIGIELNPYSIALAPRRMEQVMRRLHEAPAPVSRDAQQVLDLF